MAERTFTVQGMDCADCARTIEKGVSRLEGASNVRVDFATSKLTLEGDAPPDAIRERVEALGYKIQDEAVGTALKTSPATEGASRNAIVGFWRYLLANGTTRLALLSGVLIALGLLASWVGLDEALVNVVYVVAVIIGVYPLGRSGLSNLLINHDFNFNLLMTIAVTGAVLIGETLEGAAVVFLFAIGEALEGYSADRARDSLRSLMELAPARATRLLYGMLEETVPVEALQVGDTILVKPGERVAMDGVVTAGTGGVNQAPITGESMPVNKTAGAEVYAGTINGEGALEVRVTRIAADSTLSRIIKLVEEAQSVRAPSQRLVDRFAQRYTPAVVLAALLVAIVPPLLFGAPFYDTPQGHGWLYRALTLLVIACPCALVISTPVTIISAITAAARRGVLIKGGAYLEMLGLAKVFAFDKTGTLTHGKPVVTAARSVDCDTGEVCAACDDVLALASAVERRSSHPLAQAVVNAAQSRGVAEVYAPAQAVAMLAGRGVQGEVDGRRVTVGSHSLFDEQLPHSAELCALVDAAEAQGQTAMLLSEDERVRGFIAVADEARADSQFVIAELKALGIQTVMLTGDNATVASAIGREAGVDDVRSGLLPADKVNAVRGLLEQGKVAMVGDGVNDTPALAAATVGVAMGGAGSAQALETADVALMADDLRQLPYAVRLSRRARQLILQNVALSIGVKVLFMALALVGAASLWMAVLADEGVLLLVVLNGMRVLRVR